MYSSGRTPSRASMKFSSSFVSHRWVCRRTPYSRASTALSRRRSADTENGEHGASATRCIAPNDLSWYFSMTRAESAMISSTVCTTLSGGRPPSLTERSILPREAYMRTPISSDAANCAPSRSPRPQGRHSDGRSRSCSRFSSARPGRSASRGGCTSSYRGFSRSHRAS